MATVSRALTTPPTPTPLSFVFVSSSMVEKRSLFIAFPQACRHPRLLLCSLSVPTRGASRSVVVGGRGLWCGRAENTLALLVEVDTFLVVYVAFLYSLGDLTGSAVEANLSELLFVLTAAVVALSLVLLNLALVRTPQRSQLKLGTQFLTKKGGGKGDKQAAKAEAAEERARALTAMPPLAAGGGARPGPSLSYSSNSSSSAAAGGARDQGNPMLVSATEHTPESSAKTKEIELAGRAKGSGLAGGPGGDAGGGGSWGGKKAAPPVPTQAAPKAPPAVMSARSDTGDSSYL